MKTRIFWGNQYLKSVRVTGKETLMGKVWRQTKRVILALAVLDAVSYAMVGAYYYAKTTIKPEQVRAEVRVEVPVKDFPPILVKICQAESGGKQFTKSGKVIRGQVNPSDIGFCQIHEPTWNDKARELGYDIYTEKGNKDMALYIFENYGTDPWNSSKAGWTK